jgi:hypothetical protein
MIVSIHHPLFFILPTLFNVFEPCIVIFLCNKNQHNAHSLYDSFNLIIVSSTCFEHPSVHPQEDLYMQFYGISFMHCIYGGNIIKLHVQVFLRMNTWMFETCRRRYKLVGKFRPRTGHEGPEGE